MLFEFVEEGEGKFDGLVVQQLGDNIGFYYLVIIIYFIGKERGGGLCVVVRVWSLDRVFRLDEVIFFCFKQFLGFGISWIEFKYYCIIYRLCDFGKMV